MGAAADIAEVDLLAAQLLDGVDARAGEDVHLFVVKAGDESKPVLDVGTHLSRFPEIGHDVGLRDAQVDAPQVQHVHHILISALANNGEHAKLVAIVQDG